MTISEKDGERSLVASRDISPLEIILTEAPLVFCPDDLDSCLVCGAEGAEQCAGCGHRLCPDICAEEHQGECRVLGQLRDQGLSLDQDSILLIRMLRIREEGGPAWEHIEKMKHHSEELMKRYGKDWSPFPTKVVEVVKSISADVRSPEILGMFFGIIQINCVSWEEGKGLYKSMAFINHSCMANSVYTFNNNSIVLRANRAIQKGEEVSVNYLNIWCGQPKRRVHLSNTWFFDCACSRCSDVTEFGTNLSAFKCESCCEGLILPNTTDLDSDWSCRFCGNPVASSTVTGIIATLEEELGHIVDTDYTVAGLQSFVSKNSHQLHSKHYLNIMAQKHMMMILSDQKTLNRASAKKIIQLGKSIKSTLLPLDPGYSDWLGSILKMINMSHLQILKLNLQEKKINKNDYMEESESIWKAMKEVQNCEILSSI